MVMVTRYPEFVPVQITLENPTEVAALLRCIENEVGEPDPKNKQTFPTMHSLLASLYIKIDEVIK